MLGNGRLEAMCFDGVRRLCHIRGKLRKKVSTVVYFDTVECQELVDSFGVCVDIVDAHIFIFHDKYC